MNNYRHGDNQLAGEEKEDTLSSRAELMSYFRELSVEALKKRLDVIGSALEKNHSKEEKNNNIMKLIKRYKWEKDIISDILKERQN